LGRNLGFWNTGLFISSPDPNTFRRAQAIVRGLFSGESSNVEPIRLLELGENREARKAIASLRIPELEALPARAGEAGPPMKHMLGQEYQSLSTPLTTNELSVLVSFPTREVPGLKLKPVADFNLNPPEIPQGVEIGSLLYRGEKLGRRIAISTKSLTRHTFVTGLTGSGKTNTCLALLDDAYTKKRLNFLVIDPAKTEYRFLANSPTLGKDLMIFTLGDEDVSPFRLNPFEFVRGFSLLGHIDLIKAVFNAAFPMYASMPYLLEEAILEIYQERGWDIASSTNRLIKGDLLDPKVDYTPFLPRLSDLYAKIDIVVARKGYESKVSQDLTAALKARLGSLLHGGKGLMLDTQRSIDIGTLMERPVLLELRHAGDEDERAFVMALIFAMLYEACQNRPMRDELTHVTLVEEAHRLLKNIPASISLETANPRGKAVEMFTDMMVEMRAHGEGFVVVDQMPSKLVPDVIKGSNLKIVHRLMAQDDRMAVGYAMGMKDDQIDYLPRLRQGEAVVHSEELEEPCLVLIDSMEKRLVAPETSGVDRTSHNQLKKESEKFYRQSPQLLYKYVACSLCDAPCHYYVGEDERMLMPALVSLGQQLLGLIAVGSWHACQSVGTRLQTEIRNKLRERYSESFTKGQERCLQILLASRCARGFAEAYSHAGRWDAVLQLQKGLAEILGGWPCEAAQLTALRKVMLAQIAISPASPMVGCSTCPSRCWFGFFLNRRGSSLVNNLRERIRSGTGKEKMTVQGVSALLAEYYGDRLDPSMHGYAAYCLLSQCTNDEVLLRSFRREVKSRKH
jgi:DNA helicase HerA-like ATPase